MFFSVVKDHKKDFIEGTTAMGETWVGSLCWEDPLEEGMATHFNILAWRIPMDRGVRWAIVHGTARNRM